MLQNDSICHKNASNFNSRTFLTKKENFPQKIFFQQNIFSTHEKNGRSTPLNSKAVEVDPPLLTQKLWRTLHTHCVFCKLACVPDISKCRPFT
jgi:hypothetical protein